MTLNIYWELFMKLLWTPRVKYLRFNFVPVKNATGIVMEIPCHFTSQIDGSWSKATLNSMIIPCHLSRFYLSSMEKQDMDFGQVQVMEFLWHLLRNWWDFHRIWCHFQRNCGQRVLKKSVSHFLQDSSFIKYNISELRAPILWVHICNDDPVKNVTRVFSCLFDGSLVENDTKSDGNPIIFLAQIPWKFHDLNFSKSMSCSSMERK